MNTTWYDVIRRSNTQEELFRGQHKEIVDWLDENKHLTGVEIFTNYNETVSPEEYLWRHA